MNSRLTATQILFSVIYEHHSLSELIPSLKKKNLASNDRAFAQELIFGVLRFYYKYQWITHQLLLKPLKIKDQILYPLIYSALYQLLELNLPHHAVLFETVEITKKINKPWSAKLVNGLLRNFLRKKEDLLIKINQVDAALYSHPNWFIDIIKKSYPLKWQEILLANNQKPPLTLRINTTKISAKEFLDNLNENKISASLHNFLNNAIVLNHPQDITTLPGFHEGNFSVQDASPQFCASLLLLEPNLSVLDACAAPGGKTTHILQVEKNLKKVVAVDKVQNRLDLLSANLQRLQVNCEVLCQDLTETPLPFKAQSFDRILIDAPCSALGVIRRHPDIKILRKKNDFKNLNLTQLQLLNNLWPLLKTNGILLYATCSIIPSENEAIISSFLNANPDAKEDAFELMVGHKKNIGWQILPDTNNMDGFYFARIIKSAKL
ncbi:MAG: rRNA SAM-dependent methyltransferase [Francisellaceae bacterium]|nr:rRNA SAM-dependent methyltransferase [Francisellaceae bacterium]